VLLGIEVVDEELRFQGEEYTMTPKVTSVEDYLVLVEE